jgi:hypothetical protein
LRFNRCFKQARGLVPGVIDVRRLLMPLLIQNDAAAETQAIGSGIIESGVKRFGKRLKGSEQLWNVSGIEAILAPAKQMARRRSGVVIQQVGGPAKARAA